MIHLSADHLRIVRGVLARLLPGREIVVFGSRARGDHRATSDLDLAILGDAPLTLSERAALEEAFAESDLPMKVDLVDWSSADATFRRIIERDAVALAIGAG